MVQSSGDLAGGGEEENLSSSEHVWNLLPGDSDSQCTEIHFRVLPAERHPNDSLM